MENLSDADLKKIVDEVISSLMREMPTSTSVPAAKSAGIETATMTAPEKTIAIGADHGGVQLKETLKKFLAKSGYSVIDCGTDSTDSVDYPDFARAVAEQVAGRHVWRGIMIDGAGIGSCMAANKVPGVRAAMCYDHATAFNSREHNYSGRRR